MDTKIICGFSGVGKSAFAKEYNNTLKILDLDSSEYSKEKSLFPYNYVDAIEEIYETNEYDYILISCHEEVRLELKERGLSYLIVMPDPNESLRNTYMKRWVSRGSSMEFLDKMYRNWYNLIDSCVRDISPKVYLNQYEYLDNVLLGDWYMFNEDGEICGKKF